MRRALVPMIAGLSMLIAPALPAGAQQGNRTAFCAARVQAEAADGKKATKAALDELSATAPVPAVATAAGQLADLFAKKGFKAFEGAKGSALIKTIDDDVFANCGFNRVGVTAIDYQFQGIPATVPAGTTALRLTNTAPKEQHEIVVFKLQPSAASTDPLTLLSLSEKKFSKQAEFRTATFAPAGGNGTAVGVLDPGTYVAACFIPVGGKKNGKPHFTEGMYAKFEVK